MFFCTPQQLLVFLPVISVVFGILFGFRNSISKKLLVIISLILLSFYFVILVNYLFISGIISFLFLVIIVIVCLKYNKNLSILLLSILSAYLIVGVTDNACLYLSTGSDKQETYSRGTTIGIVGLTPENIACSLNGIGIDDKTPENYMISSDEIFISFYSDDWLHPYLIEKVEKGNDLTFCCAKWTLIDFNETTTFWIPYSKFDVFCPVQKLFNIKGIYRTYEKERQESGGGITQVNQPALPVTPSIITKDITIEKFEITPKIPAPGEKAMVIFIIKNTLQIPFNISIDWFNNYTRYSGWFNISTDFYNVTEEINSYNSWYYPNIRGDWEVQLVVKFNLKNNTYSKSAVINFKVI